MIKAFVMDVDGTLTDGKIYMAASGELMKAFDIKDGYGVHEILPAHHVKTVIMTGRESEIVRNRAKELQIDYVLQNVKDKKNCLLELAKTLNLQLEEFAYIGDDMIDLEPMCCCGICACPADAVEEVRSAVHYVCVKKGGEGAVREFIEWLKTNKYLEE